MNDKVTGFEITEQIGQDCFKLQAIEENNRELITITYWNKYHTKTEARNEISLLGRRLANEYRVPLTDKYGG